MKFIENQNYDLLAMVYLIPPEFGGRDKPIYDNYKGQFYWQTQNCKSCVDWLACYYFENSFLEPNSKSLCKIILGETIKSFESCNFPVGKQFCIREGNQFVGVGLILENRAKIV